MTLEAHLPEKVTTATGEVLLTDVYAVEPVTDIAVLGCPDEQAFSDEAESYEAFCEGVEAFEGNAQAACLGTEPIPLLTRFDGEQFASLRVHILTHRGDWMTGTVTDSSINGAKGCLFLKPDRQIEGGTSGSPVITDRGELVWIISNASQGSAECTGLMPFAWNALPRWLGDRLKAAQQGN